ncbi:adenosylcobinamide-GDP ribazoletransferase [Methanosalsum natronophilum]|uniref:adenosylcobinamide-GDP ribazoletransferase n=1 Tax=Methanosalsum natronophilum TaxID=768733 RepID=UPI002167C16B|nr:adenosylcobinamide-GDP ribazoletransferase [Methanosalsum natronophilum]MCS3923334.1 adenosylcobinamide-GDP ribazoletransferase [Methanosalsum natronophilum]
MISFLSGVKASIGFLSTIPVKVDQNGFDSFNAHIYLYTVVGFLLGVIIGLSAVILDFLLPSLISAFLIVVVIYYFTGFNHLDGLADMGDGITAHGSIEKKIQAMKDVSLGIGGAAFCTILILGLFVSILTVKAEITAFSQDTYYTGLIVFSSFIVAEMSSKQAMLTVAAFGRPIHDGMGVITIKSTTPSKYLIGFVFGSIISFIAFWLLDLGIIGLVSFIMTMVVSLFILNVSNRHFGGLNGDGIGTANEIGRVVSLIILAICIKLVSGGFEWMLL